MRLNLEQASLFIFFFLGNQTCSLEIAESSCVKSWPPVPRGTTSFFFFFCSRKTMKAKRRAWEKKCAHAEVDGRYQHDVRWACAEVGGAGGCFYDSASAAMQKTTKTSCKAFTRLRGENEAAMRNGSRGAASLERAEASSSLASSAVASLDLGHAAS